MITEIRLEDIKLFKKLCITNLPETTKLVVLFGNNGTGKTTILDAINSSRFTIDSNPSHISVTKGNRPILPPKHIKIKTATNDQFYVESRSANRYILPSNDPELKQCKIQDYGRNAIEDRAEGNLWYLYECFIEDINSEIKSHNNNSDLYEKIRDKYFQITKDIGNIIDRNINIEPGLPTLNRDPTLPIYMEKYDQTYPFSHISSGEFAIFDLLLDIHISNMRNNKIKEDNTLADSARNTRIIYCIDEPGAYVSINLQGKLLEEMFNLIKESNNQLWVGTYSIGIIDKALDIWEQNQEEVVFLNLNGHDFSKEVTITPSVVNSELIKDLYKTTAGSISKFHSRILPIFCEGSNDNQFDATCYNNIFGDKYPQHKFESIGDCNTVKSTIKYLRSIELNAIGVIDKDNQSDEGKKTEMKKIPGLHILSRYSIEHYLLDDEVLIEFCKQTECPDKIKQFIKAKSNAGSIKTIKNKAELNKIINQFYENASKIFNNGEIGGNRNDFLQNKLSKCIKPNMNTYKELEKDIFNTPTD